MTTRPQTPLAVPFDLALARQAAQSGNLRELILKIVTACPGATAEQVQAALSVVHPHAVTKMLDSGQRHGELLELRGHLYAAKDAAGLWRIVQQLAGELEGLTATRTGDGLYSFTDGQVRGMVGDAINAPMGTVPGSCETVYQDILDKEQS